MHFLDRVWRAEARALGGIAVAVTATMAAQLTISAVETVAVARLGTPVLAGVTIALSFQLLAFLFSLGVVTAVTPLAAQAWGSGDQDEARRIGQQGLLVGLAFSIPTALLMLAVGAVLMFRAGAGTEERAAGQYLLGAAWGLPAWVCYVAVRSLAVAIGRVRVTTVIMVGAVPVHATLTSWLVFGGWGVAPLGAFGAGLAYALAALAAWILLVTIDRGMPSGAFGGRLFDTIQFNGQRFRAILHLGLPFSARIVLREGLMPVAALSLVPFGPTAVAAHAVAARVLELLGTCCFGFSDAANARVGAAIGSGRRDQAGFIGLIAVQLSFMISGLLGVGVFVAPMTMAALILGDADPKAIAEAGALLPFAGVLLTLEGVQSALGGALSGMRDARGPLIIALVGAWGVGFPVGISLAHVTSVPVMGMWAGLVLGACMTTVLYGIRFRRKVAWVW